MSCTYCKICKGGINRLECCGQPTVFDEAYDPELALEKRLEFIQKTEASKAALKAEWELNAANHAIRQQQEYIAPLSARELEMILENLEWAKTHLRGSNDSPDLRRAIVVGLALTKLKLRSMREGKAG